MINAFRVKKYLVIYNMEPIFKYNVIKMNVEKCCNNYTDIIKDIQLLIQVTYNDVQTSSFYTLEFKPPDNVEPFILFENITIDIINQWIASEELTNLNFIAEKQRLTDEILNLYNAPIISKFPPNFNI